MLFYVYFTDYNIPLLSRSLLTVDSDLGNRLCEDKIRWDKGSQAQHRAEWFHRRTHMLLNSHPKQDI
jgi:hypothetical protein